ncbi:MAG: tol-pal system protein YbgF, partial [Xanthobacteraceae bacterium]
MAAVVTVALIVSSPATAQRYDDDSGDPAMRVEQLENQLRRLTGQNEELQHRNRLLEQQLQQLQGGAGQPAGNVAAMPPAQTRTGPANPYGQQPPPRQPSYDASPAAAAGNLPPVSAQPPAQQE